MKKLIIANCPENLRASARIDFRGSRTVYNSFIINPRRDYGILATVTTRKLVDSCGRKWN